MSQAKVDKYKKQKKNRAKEIKKQKNVKFAKLLILCAVIGAIIGYPAGKIAYKIHSNNQYKKATVEADNLDQWSQEYWQENYQGSLGFVAPTSTNTDAE